MQDATNFDASAWYETHLLTLTDIPFPEIIEQVQRGEIEGFQFLIPFVRGSAVILLGENKHSIFQTTKGSQVAKGLGIILEVPNETHKEKNTSCGLRIFIAENELFPRDHRIRIVTFNLSDEEKAPIESQADHGLIKIDLPLSKHLMTAIFIDESSEPALAISSLPGTYTHPNPLLQIWAGREMFKELNHQASVLLPA